MSTRKLIERCDALKDGETELRRSQAVAIFDCIAADFDWQALGGHAPA